jgi:hypothetical protein
MVFQSLLMEIFRKSLLPYVFFKVPKLYDLDFGIRVALSANESVVGDDELNEHAWSLNPAKFLAAVGHLAP